MKKARDIIYDELAAKCPPEKRKEVIVNAIVNMLFDPAVSLPPELHARVMEWLLSPRDCDLKNAALERKFMENI